MEWGQHFHPASLLPVKQIDRLYRVAERLNGVQVIGAVSALTYLLENSYLDDPRAMFYIDAPYLSADEDEKN